MSFCFLLCSFVGNKCIIEKYTYNQLIGCITPIAMVDLQFNTHSRQGKEKEHVNEKSIIMGVIHHVSDLYSFLFLFFRDSLLQETS
jgi:hypothetical protein